MVTPRALSKVEAWPHRAGVKVDFVAQLVDVSSEVSFAIVVVNPPVTTILFRAESYAIACVSLGIGVGVVVNGVHVAPSYSHTSFNLVGVAAAERPPYITTLLRKESNTMACRNRAGGGEAMVLIDQLTPLYSHVSCSTAPEGP
jgi:hypothetical protein